MSLFTNPFLCGLKLTGVRWGDLSGSFCCSSATLSFVTICSNICIFNILPRVFVSVIFFSFFHKIFFRSILNRKYNFFYFKYPFINFNNNNFHLKKFSISIWKCVHCIKLNFVFKTTFFLCAFKIWINFICFYFSSLHFKFHEMKISQACFIFALHFSFIVH